MPPHEASSQGAAGSDLRVTIIVEGGKEFVEIGCGAGR
jgi:hypothetical protein